MSQGAKSASSYLNARVCFFITAVKWAPSVFSKAASKKSFSKYIYIFIFLPGLQEVVVVIQSQRNSYHARRSEQRKVEILQQAAEVGTVTPQSEDV